MTASEPRITLLILLVGGIVVLFVLVKAFLSRLKIPALVGYILLGFLLRLAEKHFHLLSGEGLAVFEFLSVLGVICLLFRIGLEVDLEGLVSQLRRACLIWVGNVGVSGLFGYLTAYYLLHLPLVPSLVIATALTATSVGITTSVWQENRGLKSSLGELFVDVAAMDDLSGVIFMAMLFSIVPVLGSGSQVPLGHLFLETAGPFVVKLGVFGALCIVFSLFIERHVTSFFERAVSPPAPMLVVVGIGVIIASLAGLLGFSVAIGAFFAGLVFSRDPEAVKMESSFWSLYELFTPFFFLGIGLDIDPASFKAALGLGAVLVVAAVLGKLIGTIGTALHAVGWTGSLLLGVSMIPRAEIMMVIMQRSLKLGLGVVPSRLFGAAVVVSAATCVVPPLVLQLMFRRWPQHPGPKGPCQPG